MHPRFLPIPPHYDPAQVGTVWPVAYQQRAAQAAAWADQQQIGAASADGLRICLLLIDVQNTFCIPGHELFVAGRSGEGAVADNRRLCAFIYHNLAQITQIVATLDTHQAMQIFHPLFLIDAAGAHPAPYTRISAADIRQGRWRFNRAAAHSLGLDPEAVQAQLIHYTAELARRGKYDLTIWPYHAMLGGISHALVPAVEEAIFFHTVARASQPHFEIKGRHPLTEHYSAIGPEVLTGPDGQLLATKNRALVRRLAEFDAVVVAGQAKSHCVAWTLDDLLANLELADGRLRADQIYLLEDCTSPVVVPGALDYTAEAEAAFDRFAAAGMHIVASSDPIQSWPALARCS